MNILTIPLNEADKIRYGYADTAIWKLVTPQTIVDTDRWIIHYQTIVEHIPTSKFYKIHWLQGATEQQDLSLLEQFWSETKVELVEVKPVQKTITEYVPV